VSVVDLIDTAVRDYEMSPDAMRWAPDLPVDRRPNPHATTVDVDAFRRHFEQFADHLRRWVRQVEPAFTEFGRQLQLLIATADAGKQSDLRRMRTAYARRLRARRRRSR